MPFFENIFDTFSEKNKFHQLFGREISGRILYIFLSKLSNIILCTLPFVAYNFFTRTQPENKISYILQKFLEFLTEKIKIFFSFFSVFDIFDGLAAKNMDEFSETSVLSLTTDANSDCSISRKCSISEDDDDNVRALMKFVIVFPKRQDRGDFKMM